MQIEKRTRDDEQTYEGHDAQGVVPAQEADAAPTEAQVLEAEAEKPCLPDARPDFIGDYQVLTPIAQGGMAQVYLARPPGATGAHRQVAVKRLRPDMANDERFVAMFIDELQIASRVCHPNVCTVLDYGASHGEAFLVMEHLVGETLASMRRKLSHLASTSASSFTLKERIALVCRVVADACEGLHAAHEQKDIEGKSLEIVHRDVSPENILVTFDGCVKVLDFGVARATCQTHTTQAGDVKGKFAYMAPEILDGREATRQTDVWGLGVVLWELLTLKRLFRKDTDAKTLQAVMTLTPEPPSKHQPGIPAALDAIVMAALKRDPSERISTARDLGQALTAFLTRRRVASSSAHTAEFMQRLFPNGAEEQRRHLQAALSGKPMVVDTASSSSPSHPSLRSHSRHSRGGARIRTCATKVISAFRRKPWRLIMASGVTGAGLWWMIADGQAGAQAPMVNAASPPATQVSAADTETLDRELQMARVLKAAGGRIDVVQSTDDTVTVRIKVNSTNAGNAKTASAGH